MAEGGGWKKVLGGIVAGLAVLRVILVLWRIIGGGAERQDPAAIARAVGTEQIAPLQAICRQAGGYSSGPLGGLCIYPGAAGDLPAGCAIERVRIAGGAATATARVASVGGGTVTRAATSGAGGTASAAPAGWVTTPVRTGFPKDVAFDMAGNLYVADSGNDRVQKLAPDGAPLAAWGVSGSGRGQLRGPEGLALDQAGNLYVTERGNSRVQRFSPAGESLAVWPGTSWEIYGIALDAGGAIYVADTGKNAIRRLAP